jgi:NTP pyrophosphatase (non-canonical NTP hydrolase)
VKLSDEDYERSRSTFNAYAGMWQPHLPASPWSSLQVRVMRWEVHNFGAVPAVQQTLGIGEEIGELIETLFGDLDETEGAGTARRVLDLANVVDAIADAMFYATNLAGSWRLDAGELWRASDFVVKRMNESSALHGMSATVGRLNRAALKAAQKIRGYDQSEKTRRIVADNIARLFYYARCLGSWLSIDVRRGFEEVAEQVMTRDWKRFPTDGRTK